MMVAYSILLLWQILLIMFQLNHRNISFPFNFIFSIKAKYLFQMVARSEEICHILSMKFNGKGHLKKMHT